MTNWTGFTPFSICKFQISAELLPLVVRSERCFFCTGYSELQRKVFSVKNLMKEYVVIWFTFIQYNSRWVILFWEKPIQVLSIFNHLNVGALLEGANYEECTNVRIQGFSGSKIRFLAHLSRRLKWAFLIKICPLSVVVVVVIVVVVNFSHFHLLLQNHWANFNQTWHKASLGKGDSSLFKWRAAPFSKGR